MENPIAVLELTSSSIKLVVGYLLDDEPCIIYATEKPISGLIEKGKILDLNKLAKEIIDLKHIRDAGSKLEISIQDISIIIPPFGLQVFQNNKMTNVVSSIGKIDNIDISNVILLVKKEALPSEDEIVDIIPDIFIYGQDKASIVPPIGETSNTLTIRAKVHTLPKEMMNAFKLVCAQANMRVRRIVTAPYAASQLINTMDYPNDYILVDMGAESTTVSLIGGNQLYGSSFFFHGGNELSELIAKSFNISLIEATRIKELYGVDNRKTVFRAPIIKKENDNEDIYNVDLNKIIAGYFDEFSKNMKLAIDDLLREYDESFRSLPFVFIGGASQLNGLKTEIKKHFFNNEIYFACPKSLGARSTIFTNTVGGIVVYAQNRGTLEDNRMKVSPISREDNSANHDEDEI